MFKFIVWTLFLWFLWRSWRKLWLETREYLRQRKNAPPPPPPPSQLETQVVKCERCGVYVPLNEVRQKSNDPTRYECISPCLSDRP